MEFRVLGPLEVWDGDRPIDLSGAKQLALLAVLLLHANEVVSSDRLIDELWGGESPGSGTAALRVRVSQLRKALPGDVIVTRPPGYLIRIGANELDLHRFERLAEDGTRALDEGDAAGAAGLLRRALALWRGPALVEFAYESFARQAIGRLEEVRLAVLERRVEADLALGRHAELVGELEGLVAEHPLRERPRGQLMLALYRSGRQAEALEAYRQARDHLVGQLGIEPGPALKELEQAILRQDPSLVGGKQGAGLPAGEMKQAERALLVAVLDDEALESLLELAEALARTPPREVIVARLPADAGELAAVTARLHTRGDELAERGVIARVAVFTSTSLGVDLVRLSSEQDVDLVLLDAPASLLDDGRADGDLADVLADAPCDVALLFERARGMGSSVLVPFGGLEHDWAAVELGAWVARARGAPLRLVGVASAPRAGKRDASRLLSHASLAVQRALGVVAEPLLVPPGEEGIVAASADAGLLVVGLSARWRREGLGSTRLALARQARSPVLLVRRGLRPGGLAPREGRTRFTWSVRAGG